MDLIEFLREENLRIRKMIEKLITNYRIWSREEVFDRVREINDATIVHVHKQRHLLVNKLMGRETVSDAAAATNHALNAVEDEIGRLVEVHVDEPEYESCLQSLLERIVNLASVSEQFYAEARRILSKEEMDALNEDFKAHLFQSSSGAEAMTTHPGVEDISIHDRL